MAINNPSPNFEHLAHSNFDAVEYLNEVLPSLALSTQTNAVPKQNRGTLLQNASTETQTFLAQLNTHNIRSSSELTTITDGILRSANRLAYEVEVLRGDANNLYEILTDTLKDDIKQFVISTNTDITPGSLQEVRDDATRIKDADVMEDKVAYGDNPDFVRQLHLLGLLKTRLEGVITIFGEAMKWPIAPSEVTGNSSLISVSAPELGVVTTAEDDKARDYARQLRDEITTLLDSDGNGQSGLQAAIQKVNDLKRLVEVWKDTTEEKARIKLVEGLSRMVADRKRVLDSRAASTRTGGEGSTNRSSSMPGRAGRIVEGSTNTAAGLFRKIRDEIYLE